jgi:uncharacterized protein DUF955
MTAREAILEGSQAAQRLHLQLGTREALQRGDISRIDVFGVAMQLGAVLLFRRLDGLLGAYLASPVTPTPGIVVSTERDLHVQRFTAAHELGHFFMKHELSLDEQVGLWRGESKDLREVAADAFASDFMLPRWLYIHHAGRHQWQAAALQRPEITYQLSLRLGASYDATCWGLIGHKILPSKAVEKLRKSEPKALKLQALAGRADLANPWSDVWIITPADDGLAFEGGPDDIVIFRCPERAAAGYLWDESRLQQQGFEVLADGRDEQNPECGGEVTRVLVTRVNERRSYRVSLSERRPWRPDDSPSTLSVAFDMHGKEEGLPRLARKAIAAA